MLILDTMLPLRCQQELMLDVTQRLLVVIYRRFRTTYRSHLQLSRVLDCLTLEIGADRLAKNVDNY